MKQTQIGLLLAALTFITSFGQDTRSAADASVQPVAVSDNLPATVFRDCPACPEMVVIPAGNFTMGSSAAEKSWAVSHGATPGSVSDEAPQHNVSLRSFAIGKYDVTRREYAAFVRDTGYRSGDGCYDNGNPNSPRRDGASWESPGFKQTDNDPVICVSWDDARAYVSWLNSKVRRSSSTSGDGPYRLPTESEWEYAARAGTTTRFWWGDDDAAAAAHAWYKENSGGQTHPVGMKPANRFGLHDMAGNVWQWTEDCYAESYAGAPSDGSAAEKGNACLRVDRGGSWYYPAWLLRPATRERNPADYRDKVMGFRVAKMLTLSAQPSQQAAPRVVDLKASDGVVLKACYFAAVRRKGFGAARHSRVAGVVRDGHGAVPRRDTPRRAACTEEAR